MYELLPEPHFFFKYLLQFFIIKIVTTVARTPMNTATAISTYKP
jgi:hypothetical protein